MKVTLGLEESGTVDVVPLCGFGYTGGTGVESLNSFFTSLFEAAVGVVIADGVDAVRALLFLCWVLLVSVGLVGLFVCFWHHFCFDAVLLSEACDTDIVDASLFQFISFQIRVSSARSVCLNAHLV